MAHNTTKPSRPPSQRFGKFIGTPSEILAGWLRVSCTTDPRIAESPLDEERVREEADERTRPWCVNIMRQRDFYEPLLRYPEHANPLGETLATHLQWCRGYISRWNVNQGFGFLVVHEDDVGRVGCEELFFHASRYVKLELDIIAGKRGIPTAGIIYPSGDRNDQKQVQIPHSLDRGDHVLFTAQLSTRTGKLQAKDWTHAVESCDSMKRILHGVDGQRAHACLAPVLELWLVERLPVGPPKADNTTKKFVQNTELKRKCVLRTNIHWLFALFIEKSFECGLYEGEYYPEFRIAVGDHDNYGTITESTAFNFPLEIAKPLRDRLNERLAVRLPDYASLGESPEFQDHGDYSLEQIQIAG